MKTSLLSKRFVEIKTQWHKVEGTKRPQGGPYQQSGYVVDTADLINWEVKALNLLNMACQKDSVHVQRFEKEQVSKSLRSNYDKLKQLGAILDAAEDDFEGGYLNSVRNLVHSEVFDSELDQAKELLAQKYKVPAAVVAGVVLETTLRRLCLDRKLDVGKLDKMNVDLARDQCYTLLVQKRITALADIRNNAAHGHPDKFSDPDVADMITYVERFITEHLSA